MQLLFNMHRDQSLTEKYLEMHLNGAEVSAQGQRPMIGGELVK